MYHSVQQGECLTRIAARYGFRDVRSIYDHPENEKFRKKRPDPNVIFPGDRIFIPEKNSKLESCSTGKVHTFVTPALSRLFKITVRGWEGNALSNQPYELVVEGQTFRGTTDGQGGIAKKIPPDAERGTLKIGSHVWQLAIAHLNPVHDAPDEGVSGIQARLRNLGYDPGPIDGKLGPRTRDAVRAFQEDHPPLKADSICGPKTKAKLIEEYGC